MNGFLKIVFIISFFSYPIAKAQSFQPRVNFGQADLRVTMARPGNLPLNRLWATYQHFLYHEIYRISLFLILNGRIG